MENNGLAMNSGTEVKNHFLYIENGKLIHIYMHFQILKIIAFVGKVIQTKLTS